MMGQAQTKSKKKNKGVVKFESKEEYFIRNGAILLEKIIVLSRGQDVLEQLKILSQGEIEKATNNYDPNLIGADLCEANVYLGNLDDREVFIKTPKELVSNSEVVDLFLTDVSIAMVIRSHDNMNKIYGCCLETYIPMIVYRSVSRRKSLHPYLHGDLALKKVLKWKNRLKVAIDVAYALSYMHNALSKPVVHRDVKSYCILIDSSFHAILANVAYSVSITPGKKDQKWPVHGTPGYIDPEYIETGEVAEKCDVYNFGVLMLELLTGMDPSEMAKCGKNLVDEFVSGVEGNEGIKEMIDSNILEEGNTDEIWRFVRLGLKCVAKKGDERPSMISVVEELWEIQDQDDNGCRSIS